MIQELLLTKVLAKKEGANQLGCPLPGPSFERTTQQFRTQNSAIIIEEEETQTS
jgi:hypothetical protein